MSTFNPFKRIKKFFTDFKADYTSTIANLQAKVYFWYSLFIIVSLIINLFDISGPELEWLNGSYLAVMVFLTIIALKHWITLSSAIAWVTLISGVCTCVEMFIMAFLNTEYALMLIVSDAFLLMLNLIMSFLSYQRWASVLEMIMIAATYTICIFITGNDSLLNFYGIFMVSFVCVAMVSNRLTLGSRKIIDENEAMKEQERALLSFLQLSPEALQEYIKLMNAGKTREATALMLKSINSRSRRVMIDCVDEFQRTAEVERHDLASVFPMMTPTELEIIRLVLMGRRLSELCNELNKTEGTINTHRAHIRKKLGMKTNEDLEWKLKEILEQEQGA